MTPEYIHLVTNQVFIRYCGKLYEWAIEYNERFRQLPEQVRWKIKEAHAGVDYFDQAVELANQEYAMELQDHHLSPISRMDLQRSAYLISHRIPDDLVGIVYFWFSNHAPLYLETRSGDTFYELTSQPNGQITKDDLFREFIHWVEKTERLDNLKQVTSGDLLMDEVRGQFHRIVDAITENNSYLGQIFQQHTGIARDPSSEILSEAQRQFNSNMKDR